MNRSCPECGQGYIGRSDKKYCSDHCRNNCHNNRGRRINNLVRRINRRLSLNRRILKELNPLGINTVNREILDAKGFDFDLFTKVESSDTDKQLYYCYEQAYRFLSNSKVLLLDHVTARKKEKSRNSRLTVHN